MRLRTVLRIVAFGLAAFACGRPILAQDRLAVEIVPQSRHHGPASSVAFSPGNRFALSGYGNALSACLFARAQACAILKKALKYCAAS